MVGLRPWLGGGGRSCSWSSSSTVVVVQVVLQGRLVCLPSLLVLQQHLLDPDLLQDGGKLVVVEEVDHGVLEEEEEGVSVSVSADCLYRANLTFHDPGVRV